MGGRRARCTLELDTMKFTKITAAVALMVAGSAFAATPAARIAISSGASASKGNLALALKNLCSASFAEFKNGSNVSTYVCATGTFSATPTAAEYAASTAVNFTGTSYAELRLNVAGGSFTAACLLAGWPTGTKCPAADLYLDPAAGANAVAPTGSVVVGGLMDVEPTGFLSSVRSGIATPVSVVTAGFAQTFGVAVSNDLYAAMFADQQAAGKVAASCLVSDTAKAECVPVIGKAQMAAIMGANSTNDAYVKGANFLAPSLASGTAMTYARRVDTSGTQAAAQQYFLGNVCNSAPAPVVAESASAGAITVQAQSGTGGVRNQLNGVNSAGASIGSPNYSIGIMSGENNQASDTVNSIVVPTTWKWVRVGGMAMADSAAPAEAGVSFSNTATSKDGSYDYWFVSRIAQANATAPKAFWTAVKGAFAAVPANNTKGLFAASETNFTKSNSCNPVNQ
jgi:hypothetical protein